MLFRSCPGCPAWKWQCQDWKPGSPAGHGDHGGTQVSGPRASSNVQRPNSRASTQAPPSPSLQPTIRAQKQCGHEPQRQRKPTVTQLHCWDNPFSQVPSAHRCTQPENTPSRGNPQPPPWATLLPRPQPTRPHRAHHHIRQQNLAPQQLPTPCPREGPSNMNPLETADRKSTRLNSSH